MATTREHAEYKQVTVLFADVVRSMHLASAVEAERLREIMTGIFNRSTVGVHRYAGTVDKFTGEGTWPARRCPPRGTPSCRRRSSPRRCQRCR